MVEIKSCLYNKKKIKNCCGTYYECKCDTTKSLKVQLYENINIHFYIIESVKLTLNLL